MNPGTFVTLLIFSWLLLAGVTLWALLRGSMRRARLQKSFAERRITPTPQASESSPAAIPSAQALERPARKRHAGWLVWNR